MKKRNLFMSATIMCALLTVSFTFNNNQLSWLWSENKPVAIILGILAVIFGIQWIKFQKLLKNADENKNAGKISG